MTFPRSRRPRTAVATNHEAANVTACVERPLQRRLPALVFDRLFCLFAFASIIAPLQSPVSAHATARTRPCAHGPKSSGRRRAHNPYCKSVEDSDAAPKMSFAQESTAALTPVVRMDHTAETPFPSSATRSSGLPAACWLECGTSASVKHPCVLALASARVWGHWRVRAWRMVACEHACPCSRLSAHTRPCAEKLLAVQGRQSACLVV